MKATILALVLGFISLQTADCYGILLEPLVFPSDWHREEYKRADWKPFEFGVYTDHATQVADFYIRFNEPPTFSGQKHGFWLDIYDVPSIDEVGSSTHPYRDAVIMGWTFPDLSHEGIYSTTQHGPGSYGPEMGPIPYTLNDATLNFSLSFTNLNVNSGDFGYLLQSRHAGAPSGATNTIVKGYTNRTYNANVPEPATAFLLATGLVGLSGIPIRKVLEK